jgi:hypothetical protein
MTDRDHDHRTDDAPLDHEVPREVDGERDVDLDDAAEIDLPPATLDPDERVEVEPDPDIALDGDRPAL